MRLNALSAIEKDLAPQGKSVLKSRKYWPQLCKAVLSGAGFLRRFEAPEAFYAWCDIFDRDDLTRPGLPLIIANNVQGFGFPLACEFVKELGYSNYGKPDVQVISLFEALGLCERSAGDTRRDYEVLQDMFRAARNNGVTTYELDKVFWLIGSGDFYKDGFRIKSHRDKFIEHARRELKI